MNYVIDNSKEKYCTRSAKKINIIQENIKVYWSLLKTFMNDKKMPVIPPLIHENNFVTFFKEKAEFLNSFFAKQCPLKNYSKSHSRLHLLPDKRLLNVRF